MKNTDHIWVHPLPFSILFTQNNYGINLENIMIHILEKPSQPVSELCQPTDLTKRPDDLNPWEATTMSHIHSTDFERNQL